VFDVVLGQNAFQDTPTIINPTPPQDWVVAIRDPLNNFRMGIYFTIDGNVPVNPTYIEQILGPIVDGNYINPAVDCTPACTTHSADNLTGNFGLVPQVSETPLPAALPLFATGLGAFGLLGWRRKRKNASLAA
jgi:hypothetical protein